MGNTHEQAIHSLAADKHVNNSSVWIGKRAAYTHTRARNLLVGNPLNTLLFPLGILWFVILNCTLNVLSGGLTHYHLKTNLPTAYTSSEGAKDILRPPAVADHHSQYSSLRSPSSWKPVSQRSSEYIQHFSGESSQEMPTPKTENT